MARCLWKNTAVTAVMRDASGVAGVRQRRGTVATRKVVNCAGAWAASVATMVDIDLPVEPLRRMLVPTRALRRISSHRADDHRHVEWISFSPGGSRILAGLE